MATRITEQEDVVLGRPDWAMIFHDLAASMYKVRPDLKTRQDEDLHAILICIHEGLSGKTDLHTLAELCIAQSHKVESYRSSLIWTPGAS